MDLQTQEEENTRMLSQLTIYADVENQRDKLKEDLEIERAKNKSFTAEINNIRQEAEDLRVKDQNMIKVLNKEIQQIEFERDELLGTVSDRENKIKNLMGINLDL